MHGKILYQPSLFLGMLGQSTLQFRLCPPNRNSRVLYFELVRPITKKALLSSDSSSAMQDLKELIDLSLSGRGPVWFDIPLSFSIRVFLQMNRKPPSAHANDSQYSNIQLGSFLNSLTTSSRPFVIIGRGFPAYKKAAFISSLESLEFLTLLRTHLLAHHSPKMLNFIRV